MDNAIIGITTQKIFKKLGSNQALSDISMTFQPGEMHGLIGPEGAGKTTLLRTLINLLHPDQGKISFTANGTSAAFADIRSEIAYMPQQQSLYADLSISEHLDFFSQLYELTPHIYKTRRQELLHMTRMEQFADRPAGKLSGGMYKKLGLMCALLRSPRAVILDEPTNGVDPISRREFWDLLYQLSHQKILIILATAYMDEAERCTKVHLIDSGKCLAEGEPRALLKEESVDNFDALFIKRQRDESHGKR